MVVESKKICSFCKIEKELFQFSISNIKRRFYCCKKCQSIRTANFNNLNREKRKIYSKRYREKNKQKLKEKRDKNRDYQRQKDKVYYQNNKNRICLRVNTYFKNKTNKLDDMYIKRLLIKESNLKLSDIPKELIEAKREQIKLKRYLEENYK